MNREFLIKSLEGMLDHAGAWGVEAQGEYWRSISHVVLKQLQVYRGHDFYTSAVSAASSFSGAPLNGIADYRDRFNAFPWTWLARRITNLLVRLPARSSVFNPLWRIVTGRLADTMSVNTAPGLYETLTGWAYHAVREDVLRLDVRSPDCYGVDLVSIDGRKLAYKTLRDLDILLAFQALAAARPDTVVEIGAGVGELARLALRTGFARRYVIVDIPPTLAFSQTLIASEFPAERLSFFRPDRKSISDDGSLCYFLTPDQIDCIPRFDTGINIASFGEMTKGIASGYIGALKRAGFREFFSINQRIGKDFNKDAFGEREYMDWFGNEFDVRHRHGFSSRGPVRPFMPDLPSVQGYQLLHFVRRD